MPSIYTNLKKSDKKHIRTEKARIRRQFLDFAKQEELITELYKKMVPAAILEAVKAPKEVKVPKATKETKVAKETKVTKAAKAKKAAPKKVKA